MLTDDLLQQRAVELGAVLSAANLTFATAESCTGGWIGKTCTDVAGSSSWFNGGVISYSNAAKQQLLGVSDSALATCGAVSEAVVKEMATGAARTLNADCAVSVSGVAGPGGGTAAKPVGLVWIAAARRGGGGELALLAREFRFSGSREDIRRSAVECALMLVVELISRD